MAISVVMPALEMAQETGKLVAWLKRSGESVAKGEPLLEIETDKAVVEVAALADGVLGGVAAQPGDVIAVGRTIAWILDPGESVPASSDSAPAQGKAAGAVPSATHVAKPLAPTLATSEPVTRRPPVSPKARRLAKEHNVELAKLRGSGVDGEILAADILAVIGQPVPAASTPAESPVGSEEKSTAISRLMAERTTQSWTTVPHFFVTREVDATALLQARDELSAEIEKLRGVRPTLTDLIVALVARTLVKHPRVNATWTGQGIRLISEINVAVAIAVDDGVVTVVIRNAAKTNVGEIAVQRRDLTERARANRLRLEDISGATFTISNLGMHHVDSFTAIIVPPQAAILAVSAVKDRVVAIDGQPAIRPIFSLTLSSDHRVIDGARAAAFLSDLASAVLEPQQSFLRPSGA